METTQQTAQRFEANDDILKAFESHGFTDMTAVADWCDWFFESDCIAIEGYRTKQEGMIRLLWRDLSQEDEVIKDRVNLIECKTALIFDTEQLAIFIEHVRSLCPC